MAAAATPAAAERATDLYEKMCSTRMVVLLLVVLLAQGGAAQWGGNESGFAPGWNGSEFSIEILYCAFPRVHCFPCTTSLRTHPLLLLCFRLRIVYSGAEARARVAQLELFRGGSVGCHDSRRN